jgi:2-keto-3-deoxy-L-fuconate dehydrogenase
MDLDRLNPVMLITGAASGAGAASALALGPRAEGGLVLVDADEEQVSLTADAIANPPERVSTLAFDVAEKSRWEIASDFLRSQYGRLDWVLLDATGGAPGALIDFSKKSDRRGMAGALDAALLSLRYVLPLLAGNATGGSVVLLASAASLKAAPSAPGAAMKAGLVQVLRVVAKEAAASSIRINAIITDAGERELWREAPLFQDLARHDGPEAAFAQIGRLSPPLARFDAADGVARLTAMLLSDGCPVTGAALVVDGGYTL